MPIIQIKLKVGDIELEIKADGELNKEAMATIKYLLSPLASSISERLEKRNISAPEPANDSSNQSIYVLFKDTVMSVYRYGQWFTSRDALEAYYDIHDVKLKHSTVTTYLRRMEKEGILISKRQGRIIRFRLAPQICEVPRISQDRIINTV